MKLPALHNDAPDYVTWYAIVFSAASLLLVSGPPGCAPAAVNPVRDTRSAAVATGKQDLHVAAGVPGAAIPALPLFSPDGGCESALITQIRSAKREICVLAYAFTSEPLARELVARAAAGVSVRVVLDAKQAKTGVASAFAGSKVAVRIDSRHGPGIMHMKVMVLDGVRGLTGSYNYTTSAEHLNAECLVGFGGKAAAEFHKEFTRHWDHAQGN